MYYMGDEEMQRIADEVDAIVRPVLEERLGKENIGRIYVEFLEDDEIARICVEVNACLGGKKVSDGFFTLPSTLGDKMYKAVKGWFPIYDAVYCDSIHAV